MKSQLELQLELISKIKEFAENKDGTDIKSLIAQIQDLNFKDESNGQTLLHKSIKSGFILKFLSENGTLSKLDINLQDKDGLTPLHHAIMIGDTDAVHILLNLGANVNIKDNGGWSPLAHACSGSWRSTEENKLQIIQHLIEAKADTNSITNCNETILEISFRHKVSKIIIKTLIENGASFFDTNGNLKISFLEIRNFLNSPEINIEDKEEVKEGENNLAKYSDLTKLAFVLAFADLDTSALRQSVKNGLMYEFWQDDYTGEYIELDTVNRGLSEIGSDFLKNLIGNFNIKNKDSEFFKMYFTAVKYMINKGYNDIKDLQEFEDGNILDKDSAKQLLCLIALDKVPLNQDILNILLKDYLDPFSWKIHQLKVVKFSSAEPNIAEGHIDHIDSKLSGMEVLGSDDMNSTD